LQFSLHNSFASERITKREGQRMTSRPIVFTLGAFCGLATLGGFELGFSLWQGDYIAIACLSAGMTLCSYLWLTLTKNKSHKGVEWFCLLCFVLASGLALYSNLAWALWALNVPVNIGTVRDGHMGENYWLGPATLLYAVICYVVLKKQAR